MLLNSTTASPAIAMTLADFTSPSLIIPHLRGQDAASVIQELSQALQREKRVPDLLGWGSKATRSVRLVFLIAVPATDSTQYLLLISGFARLSKDSRLVEKLNAAQEAFQIFEVLQQIKLQTCPATDMLKKLRTNGAK